MSWTWNGDLDMWNFRDRVFNASFSVEDFLRRPERILETVGSLPPAQADGRPRSQQDNWTTLGTTANGGYLTTGPAASTVTFSVTGATATNMLTAFNGTPPHNPQPTTHTETPVIHHPHIRRCTPVYVSAPEIYTGQLINNLHFRFCYDKGIARLGLGPTPSQANTDCQHRDHEWLVGPPTEHQFPTNKARNATFAGMLTTQHPSPIEAATLNSPTNPARRPPDAAPLPVWPEGRTPQEIVDIGYRNEPIVLTSPASPQMWTAAALETSPAVVAPRRYAYTVHEWNRLVQWSEHQLANPWEVSPTGRTGWDGGDPIADIRRWIHAERSVSAHQPGRTDCDCYTCTARRASQQGRPGTHNVRITP